MKARQTDCESARDPADGLAAVVALRRLADQVESSEVERAVRDGWTWSLIAEALGVTRQAVHKKAETRRGGSEEALRAEAGTVPRAVKEAGIDRTELNDQTAAALDARRA